MAAAAQRLHGLDFLRALMMSLGIVLHTAQVYTVMDISDYYWDPARSPSMDALLVFINTFRMPVFFTISGFFTALLLQRRGFSAMLHNRYQRLFLPFLLFLPPLAIIMSLLRLWGFNLMVHGQVGFDLDTLKNSRLLWDNTHNLWFLYYLLMYIATLALLITLSQWPPAKRCWHKLAFTPPPLLSPITTSIFVCLFAWLGYWQDSGRVSASLSFIPKWDVYSFFGLCFLLGLLLYRNTEQLKQLAKHCWWLNASAVLCLFLALMCFAIKGNSAYAHLWHLGLSLFTALSIYCFICGLIGLFSRYFTGYHPGIRYLSDSAYWFFIFHSIPLIALALPLYYLPLLAELKFLIVCLGTIGLCWLSYHYWVRGGWIGRLLNGGKS